MIGTQLRTAALTSRSGRQVNLTVVQPEYSLDTVRLLSTTSYRWRMQAFAIERVDPAAALHAHFAAEVAWVAASELRQFTSDPQHYLLVVGLDQAQEVLGINTAYWVPDEQVWYMAVGTTRPVDQPGYPNPDQVRGIGLEIVGALVKLMNARVCAPVTLEPLDAQARRFCLARGFHAQGKELRMSRRAPRRLEQRLSPSPRGDPAPGGLAAFPDAPDLRPRQ